MSIADELARLEELRRIGSLTEIEFEEAKRQALAGQAAPQPQSYSVAGGGSLPGQIHGVQENTWCTLMHLSQLLTLSGLGIVVPIVMYITSKDESDFARRQGACMMNWFISSIIYACVFLILSMFLIGIPLLILLGIVELVFPIIAAIKANDGKVWSYPGAMPFFRED